MSLTHPRVPVLVEQVCSRRAGGTCLEHVLTAVHENSRLLWQALGY